LSPPSAVEYERAGRIGYFRGVDLLRALAAATVLVWHYQHFYIGGPAIFTGSEAVFDKTIQPFYGLLLPLYENGFWAVQMFWAISGFVFCHVYAGRATSAATFAAARFARLYPLNVITLIVITIIQSISFRLLGHYQVVGSNDPIGFVQNLLFIGGWGLPGGGNFNGPIWSVSVEIAIYALFFLIARRIFSFGLLLPVAIVFVNHLLVSNQSPVNNFNLCIYFFFWGAIIYFWLLKFHNNPVAILVPCAFCLFMFFYYVFKGRIPQMRFYHASIFLIAPTVLLMGWLDYSRRFHDWVKPVRWFGDTTYSTYLWHFPIQVAVLAVFEYFKLNHMIFNNPIVLIGWIVGMIALAHVSFRKIELPLQKFCKAAFKYASMEPDRSHA